MLTQGKKEITERVDREVEKLEDMEPPVELNPMEVKFEATGDNIREITLVTETGGPQIEINILSGTVHGFNSDYATQSFFNDDLQEYLIEKYGEQINGTTVRMFATPGKNNGGGYA